MGYRSLRDYIAALEKAGELCRIKAEVDPVLEISAITDKVSKQGGPALLFEKVKGHGMPLLINALGSERRMALAMGVEKLDDLGHRLDALITSLEEKPQGIVDKVKMLFKLKDVSEYFPRSVRSGPCQEVVMQGDQVDLTKLPVIQCWPEDGGKFITLPMVFTKDPENGKRNVGMYRMQVFDKNTTAMHWQLHKHGAHHFRKARELRKSDRIEVAVAIGNEPATMFAAICPAPDDIDELLISGFLRDEGVPLVKCKTVDLEVPAESEIILEGYVKLDDLRSEGPFGDHTGFYTLKDDFPVFHVTCVTHRKDPVYQTTIVGIPPMEDCYIGRTIERMFLPIMKKQFPEITDMSMPFEGVFHNLMLLSIKKRYPGHARKIMNGIWGLGQAMFTKCIVVVDHDVNVQHYGEVLWATLNNIDPERDIQFMLGPVDQLDHSSRLPSYGSKMGIDGTRKWKEEGFHREWPDVIRMSPDVIRKMEERWKEYGIPT